MADQQGMWEKHVTGKDGMFGRLKQNSVGETLKQNFEWKEGNQGMVFARGAATAVGAVMAYNAVMHDKTDEGEDRSMLVRLTQFIVGGGIAAAAVLAGKGK